MRELLILVVCSIPSIAWGQSVICIDPGHGGNDPGAVGCGHQEKQIVLDTSQRLRSKLQGAGFQVVMTRDNDSAVGLTARANYANSQGADRFVSIHANSAAQVATGIETFCHTSGGTSLDLRDKIQEEMIATWSLRNRGGKTANFSVLRNTSMPASLSELGFINNCNVDVTYLSSPTERDRAAEAHLRAITRHLGMQPPPTDGRLLGVAFEDTGRGTNDTSIRLPNASATIVETSATDTADGLGLWEFTVPPGNYTVRLEVAGYLTKSTQCAVVAGTDNWCSFGLFKDPNAVDAGQPDMAGMVPDAGEPDVPASPDAGPIDLGSAPDEGSVDTVPAPDSGLIVIDPGVDEDAGPASGDGVQTVGGGCGCQTERQSKQGTGWLLSLMIVGGLMLRRKPRWFPLMVLLALPMTADASPDVARKIAKGTAPVISPDGRHVLISRAKLDRLEVIGPDRTRQVLTEGRGVGLRPQWTQHKTILIRPAKKPFAAKELTEVALNGERIGPAPQQIRQQADAVFWQDKRISAEDVRAFAPMVSGDRQFVVFETMSHGMFLVRLRDNKTFALGRGSAGNFSPDSKLLIFERTQDDGHQVVASGLFMVELTADEPRVQRLLDGPAIERHGSVSAQLADGSRKLAFEVDGQVFMKTMR